MLSCTVNPEQSFGLDCTSAQIVVLAHFHLLLCDIALEPAVTFIFCSCHWPVTQVCSPCLLTVAACFPFCRAVHVVCSPCWLTLASFFCRAVDAVCREGPKAVLDLVQLGAQFTTNTDGSLHLTKEGGHSDRRIVHAADVTGREIERALVAAARKHPNISFHEHHLAQDLLYDEVNGARHCLGADVLDQATNTMMRFVAPVTLLATGGAGQVYPNTTNPSVSTGDGMAMAFRAKAVMANMEFVQFHPTAFYSAAGPNSSGRTFLISEALRGEGGLLYNQSMERFMPQYDERLELAPRDVVARSIQDQMLKRGESHVLLDVSKESASKVRSCSDYQACCCHVIMICVHGGSDH